MKKFQIFLALEKQKWWLNLTIGNLPKLNVFAVKKRSEIKVTTQLMSGKLLMFAKR